jgi:hypothetical protein
MTTIVTQLYTALRQAGIDEDIARAAATAVMAAEDKDHLATKADLTELRLVLKADLEAVRADLTKTIYTTTWTAMLAVVAIFWAISAALRFIKP